MSTRFRIGEVARRTGVAVSTLRAWERRYGVLDPERTSGGHRVYAERDVLRVRRMAALLDDGYSASDAAAWINDHADEVGTNLVELRNEDPRELAQVRRHLRLAIDRFEASEVERILDRCYARFEPGFVLDEILFPVLRWAGEGWQDDPRAIAREHFVTNVVRPRLLRQVRQAATNPNRVCVAAAPEGENHDIGLIGAASLVALAGWQVHFLGAHTPAAALERAVKELGANGVLLGAVGRPTATAIIEAAPDFGEAAVVAGGTGFRPDDELPWVRARVHTGPVSEVPETLADLRIARVHRDLG